MFQKPYKSDSKEKFSMAPFPIRLLGAALSMTGIVLIALVWSTYAAYHAITVIELRNLHVQELHGKIIHLDEVLTMSARMAAVTGASSWEQRYRKFEPELDHAIKETRKFSVDFNGVDDVTQTDTANLKLVELENQSFAFVREGKLDQAKALLFSPEYEQHKKIYTAGMAHLLLRLKENLASGQQKNWSRAILSAAIVMASIALLFFTWISVGRKLNGWHNAQHNSFTQLASVEQKLRLVLDELEVRVNKRTAELAKTNADFHKEILEHKQAEIELQRIHRQLLDVSRQAGMAEVATSVLHNVGNVLNSVNVSATVISENLKKSKSSSLSKLAALLREHENDLGNFMTSDSKGKELPNYIAQLAKLLVEEQSFTLKEVNSLQKNIEHIKDIVSMQQDYAKVSGKTEIVNVVDLVEDSLRMNAGALRRHGVVICRQFQEVPPLNVDKHKVLQILVNLVRNAKYACDESKNPNKVLTVGIIEEQGAIKISIIDNGVGISNENLTRIFNHGFTTRKDGHGFGLHSGALAAKEMGGSLIAQSKGPGLGSTFALTLPLQQNSDSEDSAPSAYETVSTCSHNFNLQPLT